MGKKLENNGLWESSRMMLPEHVKTIIQHKEWFKADPQERPVLDEQEIEDMSRKLYESKEEQTAVTVERWERDPVRGIVQLIDMRKRIIVVGNEIVKIDDILGVE
jgi:hypothetical protein